MLADTSTAKPYKSLYLNLWQAQQGTKYFLTKTSLRTQDISTNFQVITSEHRSRQPDQKKSFMFQYMQLGDGGQFLSISYPNQSSTWYIHEEPRGTQKQLQPCPYQQVTSLPITAPKKLNTKMWSKMPLKNKLCSMTLHTASSPCFQWESPEEQEQKHRNHSAGKRWKQATIFQHFRSAELQNFLKDRHTLQELLESLAQIQQESKYQW